jgi:hypothetical protein
VDYGANATLGNGGSTVFGGIVCVGINYKLGP